MDNSTTKGWRILCAHLTDLGIFGYLAGIAIGFFFDFALYINICLTFTAGLLISFLCSAVLFSILGTTPSEWLWGCKLQRADLSQSKFVSYLLHRLCLNNCEYVDSNHSIVKNFIGLLVLLVVASLYFM